MPILVQCCLNFNSAVHVADPRERGGDYAPLPILHFFSFYKNEVYKRKISIKRVRTLSQNAGNGRFRDSTFQKLQGENAPRPPPPYGKLALSALVVLPPPPVQCPLSVPGSVVCDLDENNWFTVVGNMKWISKTYPNYSYENIIWRLGNYS